MKNKVCIILNNYNDKPILEFISNYEFKNSKYYTTYNCINFEINIIIESKENLKCIFGYFMIQYKLLFFNNGYFYNIKEYKENGNVINVREKYTDIECYNTAEEYIKNYKISNIENIINIHTISSFNKIENKNIILFNAFYYLHSNKYKEILCDHRFVLLSQVCEGYIESSYHENQIKGANFEKRIGLYIELLKKINYKYKSGIFKALNMTSKGLNKKIMNSRHRYSHYVRKKNIISKDEDFVYIFYILELIFRIYILNDLNINEFDYLRENLYAIHDWMLKNKKNNIDKKNFKSISYKINN